jgi:heme/copper-type cytochrome/quinol oxidase subunit 3
MLFALAFLPMFGIGGLTGLPLGLAASDVILHDTYYVVAHFHYLVAPGTVFALFAGIYHWYPLVTGRRMDEALGRIHFWGSFVLMNAIFLPMFAMGLSGVNRRLYDAGLQYALAQPTASWQPYMTYAAIALGLLQVPFVVNLIVSALRRDGDRPNPWDATTKEWRTGGGREGHDGGGASRDGGGRSLDGGLSRGGRAASDFSRPGSHPEWTVVSGFGRTAASLGVWLFLASEVMLFASLFSGYVLVRAGAATWPDGSMLPGLGTVGGLTLLLFACTAVFRGTRGALLVSSVLAAVFVAVKIADYQSMLAAGLTPSRDLLLASWYVLTGLHALHVAGGVIVNLWHAGPGYVMAAGDPDRWRVRVHATRLYWFFVDLVWVAIVVGFHIW